MRQRTLSGCAVIVVVAVSLGVAAEARAQTPLAAAPTTAAPTAAAPTAAAPTTAAPTTATLPNAQPTGWTEPAPGTVGAPAQAFAPVAQPSSSAAAPSNPQPAVPAPQQQPPAPPTISLEQEPLPPPIQRTDHTHDGFYVRLSLGFGNLGAKLNPPNAGGAITGSGATLDLDLAIGYAIRPGIILGATGMFESLPSVELSANQPVVTDVAAAMVGPFFDGYPDSRRGFHLGGALGLASTKVQRKEAAGFTKAGGFGLAGWVGYDMWVAEQWSAGILLRLMGTRTKADAEATQYNNDAGNASMATQSIALMLTGVYN